MSTSLKSIGPLLAELGYFVLQKLTAAHEINDIIYLC